MPDVRSTPLPPPLPLPPTVDATDAKERGTAQAPRPARVAEEAAHFLPPRDSKTGGSEPDPLGESDGAVLPLPSGWACDHHVLGRHSVFGSYRVSVDGATGNGLMERLVDAIEGGAAAAGSPAAAVSVFYDKRCLNAGESWELALKNGLEGASLVMPLVSAGALKGMIENAATRRDYLLMEWEVAVRRYRSGLCLVLPVFIQSVGEDGEPCGVDFDEAAYLDAPHFMSGTSIRATVMALLEIHGVKLALDRSGAPDPAQLAEVVRKVRRMLDSQELRVMRHRAEQAYHDEQGRKEKVWKSVEAILEDGDEIGRGASSVVFRGKLHADELPVAVKALRPDAASASAHFSTELEIMKGLEVRAARGFRHRCGSMRYL